MRVVSWNAEVNRSDSEFRSGFDKLVAAHNPAVVLLQEAGDYIDCLKNSYGNKWHVYAKTGWDESTNCPVLVRSSYNAKSYGDPNGWGTVRMSTGWEGPNGHAHPGRTWTYCKVDGHWFLSLHRVTGGNAKNKSAFHEEYDELVAWIGAHDDIPTLVFGDHNCHPGDRWKGASVLVAEAVHGNLAHPGGGIDYAIRRNYRGSVTKGNAYGSDHQCVIWNGDES